MKEVDYVPVAVPELLAHALDLQTNRQRVETLKKIEAMTEAERELLVVKAARLHPLNHEELLHRQRYVGPAPDAIERSFRKALDNPCRGDSQFLKMRGI